MTVLLGVRRDETTWISRVSNKFHAGRYHDVRDSFRQRRIRPRPGGTATDTLAAIDATADSPFGSIDLTVPYRATDTPERGPVAAIDAAADAIDLAVPCVQRKGNQG